MTADSRDDSLVISDWDGNLYRIPRDVLQQYRIPNAEPLRGLPGDSSAPADPHARWWQAFMPRENGERRPPGTSTASGQTG